MPLHKFNPRKKDGSLTNAQRAANGELCTSHVFDFEENDLTTAISDLLANVMHLCDREEIEFSDCVRRAENNYFEER